MADTSLLPVPIIIHPGALWALSSEEEAPCGVLLILTGKAAALAFSPPGTHTEQSRVCVCVCMFWQLGGGTDVGAALIIS